MSLFQSESKYKTILMNSKSVADPDLELGGGGGGREGPGFDFLALLAFFPSVISSFFTQNRGGGPPLDLPLKMTLIYMKMKLHAELIFI